MTLFKTSQISDLESETGVVLIRPGDWVQATKRLVEENFNGETLFTHAEPGAVGHVLDVRPDGAIDVYFERTGTGTICFPDEIKRLCDCAGVRHTPAPVP